jgi:arylsulfatase A
MSYPFFRFILIIASLTVLLLGCRQGKSTETQKRPPNIIFFLVDDMGWSDLGCFGSRFYQTPNIDRLAAAGMKFTDAYAACPVCSPTRASILTGKYPATLNITDWLPGRQNTKGPQTYEKLLPPAFTQALPLEEVTMAEALQEKGYVTASIGKWHLGKEPYLPPSHGFDTSIASYHYGTPPGYFYPYYVDDNFQLPELKANGREGEYLTDRLTKEAVNFIEANRQKPFFLYMSHYAVHIPMQAKEDLLNKYRQRADSMSGNIQNNPYYAAMVESVDQSVGRIMQALAEKGLAGNTIFIFMSDNGGLSAKEGPHTPATSNAPLREGKGHLYEGGIREPLIVHWPAAVKAGSVCRVPVSSVDFYPTLLEAAGISSGSVDTRDGRSFTNLLKGEKTGRGPIFWHYPHYSNQGGKPSGAVRQGDFKLIEFYEDNSLELYNVAEDISETRNLAEEMPEKTAQLHTLLKEWRKKVNAEMPIPNPGYIPPAKEAEK